MYVVREIFQLKFGQFKPAWNLLKQAVVQDFMPKTNIRFLSDFTGNSYRLIMESEYENLADFERELREGMKSKEWQQWYQQFKENIEGSEREILKIQELNA